MSFTELVYEATKKIPKGRVSTYSRIAKSIGRPGASRAVGQVLKNNPHKDVPCHRIVRSSGELGGFRGRGSSEEKAQLLIKEGIEIKGNLIDLERFLHSKI
jgi:O-6-methylguanine DNA methyltransferase